MTGDVEPRFKFRTVCACGCGLEGAPRRGRPEGHVRDCACSACRAGANRRMGVQRQRQAAKRLGVTGRTGNEESWSDDLFASEVKSGAQVRAAWTVWLRIEAQVMASRASHGDRGRPVRAVLMAEDSKSEGLVIVRLSTWEDLIRPALAATHGP